MNRAHIKAPAKINLHLRVLSRRPDGYHNIETLFQAIDLFDELIMEKSEYETRLSVPGYPELETQSNLILMAQKELESIAGSSLPAKITLKKNIPVAGGLGGGSSNCAAALLGLRELYGLDMDDHDLIRSAAKLGADVPFFLMGAAAVGKGIGDELTPVDIEADYELILINPRVAVDTGRMYRLLSEAYLTGGPTQVNLLGDLNRGEGPIDLLYNDFQAHIVQGHAADKKGFMEYGEIARALEILERFAAGRCLMSGSGSTVFGIFDNGAAPLGEISEAVPREWLVFRSQPIKTGVTITAS
jgi:4-diphosphocytidyl-2-C-methyl-D-erythritol kinase